MNYEKDNLDGIEEDEDKNSEESENIEEKEDINETEKSAEPERKPTPAKITEEPARAPGSVGSVTYDYSQKKSDGGKSGKSALIFGIIAAVVVVILSISIIVGLSDRVGTGVINPPKTSDTGTNETVVPSSATPATKIEGGVVVYEGDENWVNDGTLVTNDAVVNAVYHVVDSVVAITTEKVSYNSYYGSYVSKGAGSGVVIAEKQDEDGKAVLSYIITNNHVIEGANTITVTLSNGDNYEATLVGTDSQSDIAVVTIKAVGLTKAAFGDSKSLRLGQTVIAIGNPLGSLAGSVTSGIISSLERDIKIDGVNMKLLQTNASINPGNSGGGLFDLSGKLIGIVNAKSSGTNIEGIGFAIPVSTAKEIASDIIENGFVSGRPIIGVTGAKVTADNYTSFQGDALYSDYIYKYYKAYGTLLPGFYITGDDDVVYANNDGEKFRYGDIIAEIGGTKVEDSASITAALASYKPGDKVTVRVYRLVEEELPSIFGGTRVQTKIKSFDVEVILSENTGK